MYNGMIDSWKNIDNEDFKLGIFLWVFHTDKIPPHIGISKDGFYFSLKVSSKDENIPVEKICKLLKTKKIPTLIIKTSENSIKNRHLETVFEKYQTANSDGLTCLTPITEIYFSETQDLILIELLNLLNEAGVMETIFGINLPTDYKGIPAYSRQDIQNRLYQLRHAKR
jgi:hypothetical protein